MSIRGRVKKYLNSAGRAAVRETVESLQDTQDLLLGRMASWQVRSMQSVGSLRDVEFKVSSQWGEDGIIDWLVERAGIPAALETFVEFGVEDYKEANTRFLLRNRNWRGLILDGNPELQAAIERDGLAWMYDLKTKSAFITRENINGLIATAVFSGEIGLLSVDVDGNDYWIWEAIEAVRPVICVCEYNAVFGDLHTISVPYDPAFVRTEKHSSNLYFGASIGALRSLAMKKGYRFAGTTSAGNDAFFVREDYASRFLEASVKRFESFPSRFKEARNAAGGLTYLDGVKRLQEIREMPVVNTETGETVRIADLGPCYSEEWLGAMEG